MFMHAHAYINKVRARTYGIEILWVGYSRDIRRIFVRYSWDIRMYRVCVGYVSGMYRECVEIYGVRKAKMIVKRRMKKIIQKLSEIRVCTTKIAVY